MLLRATIPRALAIGLAIVALDQLTKALVLAWLAPDAAWMSADELRLIANSREIIPGFFNITLITNSGAAWGILRGRNELLLAISALTVVAIVIFRRELALHPGQSTALALITGGIVGNLWDRLHYGAVVDFLDFHLGATHWPAFNVADSAICIGVGIYLIASFRAEHARESAAPPSSLPSPHEIKKL